MITRHAFYITTLDGAERCSKEAVDLVLLGGGDSSTDSWERFACFFLVLKAGESIVISGCND